MLQIFFGLLSAVLNYCSAGVIPSASVAVPSSIGIEYSKAVPYNVPPHTSRIDINSKIISPPWLAPGSIFGASPFAVTAPFAASQVVAAPAPITAAYPAVATTPIVTGPIFESPFAYPTFPSYDPTTIFG